jgi:predicted nucleic acid-binding protein
LIILDTKVVSELMRSAPDPAVIRWTGTVPTSDLAITVVTEAELRFGLARLPAGKRRDSLAGAIEQMLQGLLGGRILAFDRDATGYYGGFMAARVGRGMKTGVADAMIAAIARARDASLIATRDLSHFEGCGVRLIDPWTA